MKKTIKITLILATFLLLFVISTSLVFAEEANTKDNFTNVVTGSAIVIENKEKDKEVQTLISPSSTHIHTDSCYNGTKHVHTGNSSSGGGCYGKYTTESCNKTAYYISDYKIEDTYPCNRDYVGDYVRCPGTVTHSSRIAYYECEDGHRDSITIYDIYTCSYCGKLQEYIRPGGMPSSIECGRTVRSYKLNCGKTEGKYYDENGTEVFPICHEVVTSISAENQTITVGEDISKTATATYLDGHTGSVTCTLSAADEAKLNTVGTHSINLIYTGRVGTAKSSTTATITATITVTVEPDLESLIVTVSSTTVYNGSKPIFTVEAKYGNGVIKELKSSEYTESGWGPGWGTKYVKFSYTENGTTVESETITINVMPNVSSITINRSPSSSQVPYGTDITYTVIANYEDESSKEVSPQIINPYDKETLGSQTVKFSYSEGDETVENEDTVFVYDFPISLDVTLESNSIYETQPIEIKSSLVTFASGEEKTNLTPFITMSEYEDSPGDKVITFSFIGSHDRIVYSEPITVEILPDLYALELNKDSFVIYKGQDLDIDVYAYYNISGKKKLNDGDYQIIDFDKDTYDREGRYYTVSHTYRTTTITKQIFVKILPNISSLSLEIDPQTIEGQHIPFTLTVIYEDDEIINLSNLDIDNENLVILNYDINEVGYQDIIFKYTEGGKELQEEATIRVRAIINISLPISLLVNAGQGGLTKSNFTIENNSREPVLITITNFSRQDSSLNDVLPSAYSDWSDLGLNKSKDIAIGIEAKDRWKEKKMDSPMYIANFSKKDVGIIDINSSSTLDVLVYSGSSFAKKEDFSYNITWEIKLVD